MKNRQLEGDDCEEKEDALNPNLDYSVEQEQHFGSHPVMQHNIVLARQVKMVGK